MSDDNEKLREGEENTLPFQTIQQDPLEEQPPPPSPAPKESSPYERQEEIGRGGLGRVVKVFDRRLERTVALKEALSNRGGLERFWREAKLTARLEHPSIVPVHEAGISAEGEPFYTMKLISGEPFDAVLRRCKDRAERLALLPRIISVCEAVAYAHSKKIIHRDIKPQNILCGSFGETIVIDWGLAKELKNTAEESVRDDAAPDSDPELTTAGSVLGTPAYMPPEQAQAKTLDERADVYSLGAVLYQTLSGKQPYTAESSKSLLVKVMKEPPPPLATISPGLPTDLIAIVDKAMARDAKDRYPSAKELAEDLQKFQAGQLVGVYHYSTKELLGRWLKRHRIAVSFSLAALLLLLIGGLLSYTKISIAYEQERLQRDKAEANEQRARSAEQGALARQREAEQRELYLLEEQGRQLLQDAPEKALPVLLQAYQQAERLHEDRPALRMMLSLALGRMPRLLRSLSLDYPTAIINPKRDAVLVYTPKDPIKLWRFSTPDGLLPLVDHGHFSTSFSDDGAWLATGDTTSSLLQRTDNSATPIELPDEFHPTLNQDATLLAALHSTPNAEELIVRELPSQKILMRERIPGSSSPAAFNEDSSRLAITTFDEVIVWDLSTKTKLWQKKSPKSMLPRFTKNGTLITAQENTVQIWEAKSGEIIASLPSVAAYSFDLTQDGRRILINDEKSVSLWDITTPQQPIFSLPALKQEISFASINPEGTLLVTGSHDDDVTLWDASSGARITSLKGRHSAAFGANQTLLTTAVDKIEVWDLTALSAPKSFPSPIMSNNHTLSTNGTILGLQDSEGPLALWDLTHAKKLFETTPEQFSLWPDIIAYPKQGPISIALNTSGEMLLWNMLSNQKISKLPWSMSEGKIPNAAFSKDGERLVLLSDGATLFDTNTGNLQQKISGDFSGARFSDDGSQIYLRSAEAVYRWSTPEAEPIAQERSSAFSLSPDLSRLLLIGPDQISLWDPSQKKRLTTLTGHTAPISAATFSADNAMLATGSDDKTTRVWNAHTGALLAELSGHLGAVTAVAFTPDSRYLLTASEDNTVKLWEPKDGRLLASFGGHYSTRLANHNVLIVSPDGAFFAYTTPTGALLWPLNTEHGTATEVTAKATALLPTK